MKITTDFGGRCSRPSSHIASACSVKTWNTDNADFDSGLICGIATPFPKTWLEQLFLVALRLALAGLGLAGVFDLPQPIGFAFVIVRGLRGRNEFG